IDEKVHISAISIEDALESHLQESQQNIPSQSIKVAISLCDVDPCLDDYNPMNTMIVIDLP
ncbi:unnamed protein product, partial [Rotaria magnacalcarata]